MTSRSILITGATGGLGVALVHEAQKRGHHVRATGRNLATGEQLRANGAEFIVSDLEGSSADLGALARGRDSIIHAAALSASWGPKADFVSANIDVTNRLLDAARAQGVGRFVFISSPSIFASFDDQIGIGEHSAPNPNPLNDYASTKLAAEQAVLAARSDALACCAIRPRALVGTGDRVILPKLAELASRPRVPLPREGEAKIELTDLRDAAWAICEAEERAPNLSGRAINISGGQPHTVRDVAQQLALTLGKSPRLISIPLPFAHVFAHLLENAAKLLGMQDEPVLTRYTLATMAYSQTFDLEPARRLLGYEPRHDALTTLLVEARMMTRQENAK